MITDAPTVAIVGATGLVGREILGVLDERQFPLRDVRAYASPASAGGRVGFASRQLRVEQLTEGLVCDADIVFLAAGEAVSEELGRTAAERGSIVVDTSMRFVNEPDVPLVAPEVNADCLVTDEPTRLIAVAGGPAAVLAPVIAPLADQAGVVTVSVATYEPVSNIGQAGVSELSRQTIGLLNSQDAAPERFAQQIAFNCIPALGPVDADGYTTAERRFVTGLRRILNRPRLQASVTAVHVPLFFGLGIVATVETERAISGTAARAMLRGAPGILLAEDDSEPYATPLDVVHSDVVHVGRVRGDDERPTCLSFWAVAGNVRKVAVSAVAIAEKLSGAIHWC